MGNIHADLAKEAVEKYVLEGKVKEVPEGLPDRFYSSRSGVFVTIAKGRELRGCIGTVVPVRANLAEEIIRNAVAACSEDFRFEAIRADELAGLSYEVSLLSAPKRIPDISRHDCRTEGILVVAGDGRTGLLLPGLEGIETAQDQLRIACQKGGIDPRKDSYEIYAFSTEKYS